MDDGTAIRAAGSVPSDSHYTLPTNQDPHYLQIMDSSQGIDLEVVKHKVWKVKAITRYNKEKQFAKLQYLKQGCVEWFVLIFLLCQNGGSVCIHIFEKKVVKKLKEMGYNRAANLHKIEG